MRDLSADFSRNILTPLLRNIFRDSVWLLPLPLFLHIFTSLYWVVGAGARVHHPHLLISLTLPVVLAVLLVHHSTLCLNVIIIHCVVLGVTLLPGDGTALSLLDNVTLLASDDL